MYIQCLSPYCRSQGSRYAKSYACTGPVMLCTFRNLDPKANAELGVPFMQVIDKDVKKKVDDAVAAAKASPEIPLERMYEDIYIKPIQHVCWHCAL